MERDLLKRGANNTQKTYPPAQAGLHLHVAIYRSVYLLQRYGFGLRVMFHDRLMVWPRAPLCNNNYKKILVDDLTVYELCNR